MSLYEANFTLEILFPMLLFFLSTNVPCSSVPTAVKNCERQVSQWITKLTVGVYGVKRSSWNFATHEKHLLASNKISWG